MPMTFSVPKRHSALGVVILENKTPVARKNRPALKSFLLLAFSCKRRHFCPFCHQKRVPING
jgi:hypothetical protein